MAKPQQAQNLTERVTSLEPGIYTADSNTDGYGSLMAALDMGAAKFLGEEFLENDVRSIAIEVGGKTASSVRQNPDPEEGFTARRVRIGDDFYTRALKEYDPPMLMWFRETFQNSIDAGARFNAPKSITTRIDTTLTSNPDGSQTITVVDNCGGMSLDTLENKFLTISESGKRGDASSAGSAGGFGIAKELILFPWLSYEVHTQDTLLKGYRADYGVKKTEFLNGTRVTVKVPADYKVSGSEAIAVIERSYLKNARFRLNGEIIKPALEMEDSDEVQEFDGRGKMRMFYKPKSRKITGFFVRKTVCSPAGDECGSLFMYSMQIESSIPGCFCLDITGSSLDTLMANRMSLRYPYQADVAGYLRALVKDKHSATRKKNNAMHRKWVGAGKMVPKAEAAGALAGIMSQFVGATEKFNEATNVAGIKEILRKNEKDRAKEAEEEETAPDTSIKGPDAPADDIEETAEEKADEDGGVAEKPTYTTAPDLMDVVTQLPNVEAATPGAIGNAIKHLAWEQDFYIHNEIEGCSCGHSKDSHEGSGRKAGHCYTCDCDKYSGFKVPKRFMPTDDQGRPTMAPVLRKISRFWGEVCRAILIAADKPFTPYGVGWMFDTEFRDGQYRSTEGEYIRSEGECWLLLNPFKGGNIKDGKLFSLRSEADLDVIFSLAVHECAHLTYGESGHDEGYARELTTLIALTREIGRHLKKIRDIVVKRPDNWKPAVKPVRTPKPKKIKFNEQTEESIRRVVANIKRKIKSGARVSESIAVVDNTGRRKVNSIDVKIRYTGGYPNDFEGKITLDIHSYSSNDHALFVTTGKDESKLAEILLENIRPAVAKQFPDAVASGDSEKDASSSVLAEIRSQLIDGIMNDGANALAEAGDVLVEADFAPGDELPNTGVWKVRTRIGGDWQPTIRLFAPDDVPGHWPSGNAEMPLVNKVVDRIVNGIVRPYMDKKRA